MMNGLEDVQKTGRENMERALKSFGAVQRGWQALASETADYSRQALEDGSAHVETLLGARTLDRAVEAQSRFVRESAEKAMNQAARLGELYLGLVKDAAKPFEDIVPLKAPLNAK